MIQTSRQSTQAPAVSSRTSAGVPVRLERNDWWNSSQLATVAVDIIAKTVDSRRHESRDDAPRLPGWGVQPCAKKCKCYSSVANEVSSLAQVMVIRIPGGVADGSEEALHDRAKPTAGVFGGECSCRFDADYCDRQHDRSPNTEPPMQVFLGDCRTLQRSVKENRTHPSKLSAGHRITANIGQLLVCAYERQGPRRRR